MSLHKAQHTLRIAATPDQCFEAIADYETFPAWQQAVKEARVVERNADGLGEIVEFRIDAKFREVGYRLHYHYERPGRIWWDFLDGNGVERIEGGYTLEPDDDGTRATYTLGIDPGVPVPGLIARRLTGEVMKRSVVDLKNEAERRAGSA